MSSTEKNNDKLPIKFFSKRENDRQETEGGGSDKIPNWVLRGDALIERSNALLGNLVPLGEILAKKAEGNSIVPFLVSAKLDENAIAKSRRGDIASLFQDSSDTPNIIGLSGEAELMVQIPSSGSFAKITNRIKNASKYDRAISCLEEITSFQPKVVSKAKNCNYKVKLANFMNRELNRAIENIFEKHLNESDIAYTKTYYTSERVVYKLKELGKVALDSLIQSDIIDAIISVEPMPKYAITFDSIDSNDNITVQYPIEGREYAVVGVLDSGIASIPHLNPWVYGNTWSPYPEQKRDRSHGTFVSGIIIYGDILEGAGWVGSKGVKVFDATVIPDTEKEDIDEDELIGNIKEAIKLHHKEVQIWNLSLSIRQEASEDTFSDMAIALDEIQDAYNILERIKN